MKRLFCLVALFSVLSVPALVSAQNAAPAAVPSPAPEAKAMSPIKQELQTVVNAIKVKIRAGSRTEAALAEELKGFDTILASHKGENAEDLSAVLLMKAMLYVEVLKDLDKGEALLKQLKADFPATEIGRKSDTFLSMLAELRESQRAQAALAVGAVFPDFTEKDLAGQPLSLAKYKGKVVLVDFWATWCPPCVAELPNVLAAYQKYHDKGFEIVGISLDQEEAKLKSFMTAKGMTWAQYFDGAGWGNKLAKMYAIRSIPATFLLDRDGKIVARDLRGAALEAELEKLLGK
jgi:peroxiredoxin